jgi:hypothetical protein
MKKMLMAAVLLVAAGYVSAGWTLLQETRDGILYIDRDGAEKTANGWRVDSSQDFHKQQIHDGKEYLSEKSRYELDCSGKKIRTLNVERFPENMAGGDKIHADAKASEWSVPDKGSRLDIVLKNLCR